MKPECDLQKEAADWARNKRFATRAFALDLDKDQQKAAETDMEIYNKENSEIMIWNAALITVSFAATSTFYSQVTFHLTKPAHERGCHC